MSCGKKIIMVGLLVVAICLLLIGIHRVTFMSENAPKAAVTFFLETYKSGQTDSLMELVYTDGSRGLLEVTYGFAAEGDTTLLTQLLTTELKFTIMDASVVGNHAVVTVVMENVNLDMLMQAFMVEYMEFVEANQSRDKKLSESELAVEASRMFRARVRGGPRENVISLVSIVLKNHDNRWLLVSNEGLLNALTGNYYGFFQRLEQTRR